MKSAKQLELPLKKTHGGRRAGAGRPNLSGLRAHIPRPRLNTRYPVHVTLRLQSGLPNLRGKEAFRALRGAAKIARAKGLAISHFAILSNHVHLIVEPGRSSLTREMQSLCISLARRLNVLARRQGEVFKGRYHLHVLKTPSEVRRALTYVLTNEAKHTGHKAATVRLNPFSSAFSFRDWKKLGVKCTPSAWSDDQIEAWQSEMLTTPRTWLLMQGWKK